MRLGLRTKAEAHGDLRVDAERASGAARNVKGSEIEGDFADKDVRGATTGATANGVVAGTTSEDAVVAVTTLLEAEAYRCGPAED